MSWLNLNQGALGPPSRVCSGQITSDPDWRPGLPIGARFGLLSLGWNHIAPAEGLVQVTA
jgi:hypothetical protein